MISFLWLFQNLIARDFRDGAAKKQVALNGVEFLRRFTLHNLSRKSGFCPGALSKSGALAYITQR